jgi:hypothetical protein
VSRGWRPGPWLPRSDRTWQPSPVPHIWQAGQVYVPVTMKSAGKRLSGKSRKGSPWLRRMACQSAWAAVRTKNCYLSTQFKRLAARRGSKRALIAVAHSLLVIGNHLQSSGCSYQELGGDYFDQ